MSTEDRRKPVQSLKWDDFVFTDDKQWCCLETNLADPEKDKRSFMGAEKTTINFPICNLTGYKDGNGKLWLLFATETLTEKFCELKALEKGADGKWKIREERQQEAKAILQEIKRYALLLRDGDQLGPLQFVAEYLATNKLILEVHSVFFFNPKDPDDWKEVEETLPLLVNYYLEHPDATKRSLPDDLAEKHDRSCLQFNLINKRRDFNGLELLYEGNLPIYERIIFNPPNVQQSGFKRSTTTTGQTPEQKLASLKSLVSNPDLISLMTECGLPNTPTTRFAISMQLVTNHPPFIWSVPSTSSTEPSISSKAEKTPPKSAKTYEETDPIIYDIKTHPGWVKKSKYTLNYLSLEGMADKEVEEMTKDQRAKLLQYLKDTHKV